MDGNAPGRAHTGMPHRRVIGLVALVLVVAAGLAVHVVLADTAATDIAGDALYAIAAYLIVLVVAPRWHPLVVGSVAGMWCLTVEFFQLTGIPEQLGAAFPPAMLVLGTVFDPRDLVVYVVAVVGMAVLDLVISRLAARNS